MISAGEHVLIFGMSGCGKSTLTRQISTLYPRKIVFDRLNEWSFDATDEIFSVNDFDSFVAAYETVHMATSFTILIRPRAGLSEEALLELTNEILALAYQVEREGPQKGIGIFFEELWLYAPVHSMPSWFWECALTGRHYRISLIGNAQKPATVSKVLVSQCRHVFIGEFFEFRDREYYAQTLGRIEELTTPPAKFAFLWYRPGQKLQSISVEPM